MAIIQHEPGVRTNIGVAHAPRRNLAKLEAEARATVVKAARAVASHSGKALLRKRGEKIERSFAHVLDSGGQRRTTLRGLVNVNERYLCAIIGFNLGLVMRRLTGEGTTRPLHFAPGKKISRPRLVPPGMAPSNQACSA